MPENRSNSWTKEQTDNSQPKRPHIVHRDDHNGGQGKKAHRLQTVRSLSYPIGDRTLDAFAYPVQGQPDYSCPYDKKNATQQTVDPGR
jgi:hypothetical protein